MKFKKHYGWEQSLVDEIEHLIRNTRDSMKHLTIGMVVKPARSNFFGEIEGQDEYMLRIVNRVDPTPVVKAYSKPYPDRDTLVKRYRALLHHWKLPCCCLTHQNEIDPPLANFFEKDEDDELGGFFSSTGDDDLAGFFSNSEPDPLGSFFK